MRNKGTIIAVSVVALVLLVSAGIAVAAGISGDGTGCAGNETRYGEGRVAGDGLSYGCRNAGEESCIRAGNCVGAQSGECNGDCDQEQAQLRERDCDGTCGGTCDGDCTQSQTQERKGWSDEPAEESAAAAIQAGGGQYNGECAGDCDRDQDRPCDGSCEGICDGDGTQSQNQNRGAN